SSRRSPERSRLAGANVGGDMTTTAIVARAAWLFLLLVPLSVGARERAKANHLPLPVMDLGRFAGQWHHVAWLPVDLQRKCVRDSRVSLARVEEGFELRRSCVDSDGKLLEETADAVSVPGAPGSLQVRSAPRWRAWIPMGWSRRWVLAVDPSYQWALVGAPDQDHLWVLARQPHMDRTLLASLVERAQAMGYPWMNWCSSRVRMAARRGGFPPPSWPRPTSRSGRRRS